MDPASCSMIVEWGWKEILGLGPSIGEGPYFTWDPAVEQLELAIDLGELKTHIDSAISVSALPDPGTLDDLF